MTFEERLVAQLYLERRAHAETRRKLAKAEHDRDPLWQKNPLPAGTA